MKNNSAKKISAFLLAAAIAAPSASELAVLGTLRVSAESTASFSSENIKVSGAVFAVEITATDEVADFQTSKFTVASDAEGENKLEGVSVSSETENGTAVSGTVKIDIAFPEGTADGTYYLFYEDGAIGAVEYSAPAEEEPETLITVAEAQDIEAVEETEQNVSEMIIEETPEEVFVGDGESEDVNVPTLTAEEGVELKGYFGDNEEAVVRLKLSADDALDSYDAKNFTFKKGDSVINDMSVISRNVVKSGKSATVILDIEVEESVIDGEYTVIYNGKAVTNTIKYKKTKNSGASVKNKVTINQGESLVIDSKSGLICKGDTVLGKLKSATITNASKWAFFTTEGKSNSGAKFEGMDANGLSKPAANFIGNGTFSITSTKANNAFNNVIVLKVDNTEVLTVCVTPPVSQNLIATAKTGFTVGENNVCTLELETGKSFKPSIVTDGINKSVTYEAIYDENCKNCFTVVNGSVTGVYAGTGKIIVKPQDGATIAPITINVKVNTSSKFAGRANTTSVALVPGKEQKVTISGTSSVGKFATLKYDDKYYVVKQGSTLIENDEEFSLTNGAAVLSISLKSDLDPNSIATAIKGKNIEVSLKSTDNVSTSKSIVIKPTYTAVNTNIKSFKQTGKYKDGFIEVNVPVGTVYNLGVNVLPVTADMSFGFMNVYDDDDRPKGVSSLGDIITITGDSIYAKKAGTCCIYAKSDGKGADNKAIDSKYYKINVYEQSSSFSISDSEKSDGVSYGIRGGFLVKNPDAECDKSLLAGTKITIPAPATLGGKEEVVWTSNKATGLGVELIDEGKKLELKPIAPGSYTVTGVTKYTKQKISFKVMVAENPATITKDKLSFEMLGSDGKWFKVTNADKPEIKVGETVNIRLVGDGVGAAVAFEATNGGSINASGVLKTKSSGDVAITGKMTTKSKDSVQSDPLVLTVKAAEPVITKVSVPSYGISTDKGGKPVKVSISGKNLDNCIWVEYDENKTTELGNEKTLSLGEVGKHNVCYCKKSGSGESVVYTKLTDMYEIEIFEKEVKSIVLDNVNNSVDVKYKKGSQTLEAKRKPSELAKNAFANTTYIVPFNVYFNPKASEKVDPGDITWTSSNVYIATAEPCVSNEIPEGYNAAVKIKTKKFYDKKSGKVTLTGITRNSGKKINITLNVNGDFKELNDENESKAIAEIGSNLTVEYDGKVDENFNFTLVATLPENLKDMDVEKLDRSKFTFGKKDASGKFSKVSGLTVKYIQQDESTKKLKLTVEAKPAFATQKFYLAYNNYAGNNEIQYIKPGDGTAADLKTTDGWIEISVIEGKSGKTYEFDVNLELSDSASKEVPLKFDNKKFVLTHSGGSTDGLKLKSVDSSDGKYKLKFICEESLYNKLRPRSAYTNSVDNPIITIKYDGTAITGTTMKLVKSESSSQEPAQQDQNEE